LSTESHSKDILKELIKSTPIIKQEQKTILDELLPIDEKFVNQLTNKVLLEELGINEKREPTKIPNDFVSNFTSQNNRIHLFNNIWTNEEFDELTGFPNKLNSSPIPQQDPRLEIIEEPPKSSIDSTHTRHFLYILIIIVLS